MLNQGGTYQESAAIGKYMEIETTGMGKKIFSCTDSAVVEA